MRRTPPTSELPRCERFAPELSRQAAGGTFMREPDRPNPTPGAADSRATLRHLVALLREINGRLGR
jgi:hypothetical protein